MLSSDKNFLFLQRWRVLVRDNMQDGYIWRCQGRRCNRSKKSIRDGSWFEGGVHLALTTLVTALYFFSISRTQVEVAEYLDRLMCHLTVSVWFNYFRELFSWDMEHNRIWLGGRGHTVQVDESFFSGKRKYQRGRLVGAVDSPWILGLIDTTTKQVAMFILQDRRADTLIPLIERMVRRRTKVVTDCWRGYTRLAQSPMLYVHETVNHEENFVDPITGANTQEIEGFWTHAKRKYKTARGFGADVRANYLDEIQWRWNHRGENIFGHLLRIMSQVKNPNRDYANLPAAILATKPDVEYP